MGRKFSGQRPENQPAFTNPIDMDFEKRRMFIPRMAGSPSPHPSLGKSGRTTTYMVAASDAPAIVKAQADYVCDGTADDVEINAALTAAGGGKVTLSEGTHNCAADLIIPANSCLEGYGWSTILNFSGAAITNAITINGNNVKVRNLKVQLAAGAGAEGSRPNVVYANEKALIWLESLWLVGDTTVGSDGGFLRQHGVLFITCTDSKIVDCRIEYNRWYGILIYSSSDYNTITGNTFYANTSNSIYIYNCMNNSVIGNMVYSGGYGITIRNSNHNTVIGNTIQGSAGHGIYLNISPNSNAITGNIIRGCSLNGIMVERDGIYNTITGNICQRNGYSGIYLSNSSNNNTILGNSCIENSQTTDNTYDNIFLDASDYNLIQGNVCRAGALDNKPRYGINISNATCDGNKVINNDLYDDGFGTAPYNDEGTGTIYVEPSDTVDAIAKKHTEGDDQALGTLGTKATPVNADKVVQRNSADSDALVTSTWTQVKAFLKTYWDTLYILKSLLTTRGDIIYRNATIPARLAKGTNGQFLKIGANDPEWAWALAAPTGTAAWENRTYKGWELLETTTTYTVGSGQDFATLAEAAASLQGLILVGGIFLVLQESITLTSEVRFKGMIGAGGGVFLYLNGHDITINHNAVGIVADGYFDFYVRDNLPAPYNSIIAGADAAGSTFLLRWMNHATGNTYHINLDANSKAIAAMLYVSNDARCYVHTATVFLDTGAGGLYGNAVKILYGGFVSASVTLGVAADDPSINSGSMAIDSAGHIHTAAGEYTP